MSCIQYLNGEKKLSIDKPRKIPVISLKSVARRNQIINLLKSDSRMRISVISDRLGVSVSTVHYHINRLRKDYDFIIVPKKVKGGK